MRLIGRGELEGVIEMRMSIEAFFANLFSALEAEDERRYIERDELARIEDEFFEMRDKLNGKRADSMPAFYVPRDPVLHFTLFVALRDIVQFAGATYEIDGRLLKFAKDWLVILQETLIVRVK